MNSDLILSFVYSLNNRNIGIWVNEENIKLFIPEQESLSANDKQFIINNKTELIYLLSNNNILTYQDCFGILKSNISKLSFSQERLWFISQYDNSIPVYNIPRIYKLKIGVNVTHIKNSITKIVDEHEVLRTLIISDTLGNNKLSINKDVSDHIFNVYHLNSLEDLNIQIKTELSYIFNLAEENPIRVCFYHLVNKKTQIKEIYMSIIFHHIAADGWSMGIFSYELSKFYNAYSKDEMALIKENKNYLPIQYKDYATWQYYYLQGELLNKQLNFWKNYLAKYEQLNLPTDFPRPKEIDYVGNELNLILDKNLSVRLRHIAISNDISLYSLLLGGWYLLLNIYSNQSDILIGSVMANRRYANVDNIIGFFANTIAIRGKIDGKDNLLSYFKNITNDIIEIQNYQGLPFDLLIEELSVPRDMGYHPLFQIMFVLQNFGGDSEHYTNEILEDYSPTKKEIFAKFDLTVSWHDDGDNLTCNFNYRTSLFEQSTIEGYMQTYIKIIERMVEF
ncbi:MAG: amino acid adenylation protein, partial [Rickettsiaceae bacterium]|nr:amino acid adenylation protein [Rickettsiaceae bacterium]